MRKNLCGMHAIRTAAVDWTRPNPWVHLSMPEKYRGVHRVRAYFVPAGAVTCIYNRTVYSSHDLFDIPVALGRDIPYTPS